MPPQSKLTKSQKKRNTIKRQLQCLMQSFSRHYDVVDECYVRKSNGRLAHYSEHNDVNIVDAYDELIKVAKKTISSVERDGAEGTKELTLSIDILQRAFKRDYLDLFDDDYIHFDLLWHIGHVEPVISTDDVRDAKGQIDGINHDIDYEFDKIRSSIDDLQIWSDAKKSDASIKARRSAMIVNANATKVNKIGDESSDIHSDD